MVEKKVVYVEPKKFELRLPPKRTIWKCSHCGLKKEAIPENFEPTKVASKMGVYYILRKTCRICRHGQSREYKISHKSYISAARKIARQIKKEGGEV